MKQRIPNLDDFVNESEDINEKSKMMSVGDMFVIDWDGKSQVKIKNILQRMQSQL